MLREIQRNIVTELTMPLSRFDDGHSQSRPYLVAPWLVVRKPAARGLFFNLIEDNT